MGFMDLLDDDFFGDEHLDDYFDGYDDGYDDGYLNGLFDDCDDTSDDVAYPVPNFDFSDFDELVKLLEEHPENDSTLYYND